MSRASLLLLLSFLNFSKPSPDASLYSREIEKLFSLFEEYSETFPASSSSNGINSEVAWFLVTHLLAVTLTPGLPFISRPISVKLFP